MTQIYDISSDRPPKVSETLSSVGSTDTDIRHLRWNYPPSGDITADALKVSMDIQIAFLAAEVERTMAA